MIFLNILKPESSWVSMSHFSLIVWFDLNSFFDRGSSGQSVTFWFHRRSGLDRFANGFGVNRGQTGSSGNRSSRDTLKIRLIPALSEWIRKFSNLTLGGLWSGPSRDSARAFASWASFIFRLSSSCLFCQSCSSICITLPRAILCSFASSDCHTGSK